MVPCWLDWRFTLNASFILLEDDRRISAITLILKTWICSNMINLLENNLHNANFELPYAQFCLRETQGEWALKTAHCGTEVLGDKIHTCTYLKYSPSTKFISHMLWATPFHTLTTTICLISCSSSPLHSKTWTKLFWGHQHKQCSGLLQDKVTFTDVFPHFLPIYHM